MKKTKAEEDYHELVASLGCVVCRNIGEGYSPAQLHHIRIAAGMGQKSSHALVIPLCPAHHTEGGVGVAFHASKRAFEGLYGSEMELLAQTILDSHRSEDNETG